MNRSPSPARRRSAALIIIVTVALIATVVVTAVAAEGRESSRTTTNDGGAWLVNRSLGVVGHKNRAAGELSSVIRVIDSPRADVHQAQAMTVVHDPSTALLIEIDTRNFVEDHQPTELPSNSRVIAIDHAVLVVREDPLAIWKLDGRVLPTLASLEDYPPIFSDPGPGRVAATTDGMIAVALAESDQVVWVADTGSLRSPVELADPVRDMTIVGSTLVVLTEAGDLIVADRDGTVTRSGLGAAGRAISVLQQPSDHGGYPTAEAQTVVGITTDGEVVVIDFSDMAESGATVAVVAGLPGREPLAPIVHDGCIYAVVADEPTFASFCRTLETRPLSGTGADLRLRLVNGWVWVNDLADGGAWIVTEDRRLEPIQDWGLAHQRLDEEQPDDGSQNSGRTPDTITIDDAEADAPVQGADEYDPNRPNDPPVPVADSTRTRVDTMVVVPVLENDFDANNDILTVVGVELEQGQAQVTITPDRTGVQVAPAAGFRGEVVLTYQVSDGRAAPVSAAVTVTVVAESDNAAPVANTDVVAVGPGATATIDVLHDDFDPDGDSIALVGATADSGTVRWSPDGLITFTPDSTTATGWVEIIYEIADGLGGTATGLLRVEIRDRGANQEPDARNDHAVTVVGRPVVLDLLANDSDPDGDQLLVGSRPTLLTPQGAEPHTTITSDGEFVFLSDEPGTFLFSYTVTDTGDGGSERDSARIRIDVEPLKANSPPVAVRDDIVIPVGSTRIVHVLDNDGDPDGDVLNIVDWQSARGLIIEAYSDTSGHSGFWVTVEPDAPERLSFTYSISDGRSEPVWATVVVAVVREVPQDQPPVARDDVVEARAGATVTDVELLVNDFDPEGGPLRIVAVHPPEQAQVQIDPLANSVSLDIAADTTASFNVGYDITDQGGNRAAAVLKVQLIGPDAPNRPPVARADTARTRSEARLAIDVLANDSDPDNDAITIEGIAKQPLHGTARVNPINGTVEYTPDTGFVGTDLLKYAIVDSRGDRAIGDVFIGVAAGESENQPPIANDDSYSLGAGSGPTPLQVLANDFDPESDPIRVVRVGSPAVGEVTIDEFGQVEFVPPPELDSPTTVEFTYTIADSVGNQAGATVTIDLPAYRAEPEPTPTPEATVGPSPTPEPQPDPGETPTPEATPTPEPTEVPTPTPTPTPTANEPPVAVADEVGPAKANTELRIPVLANDFDPDGDAADLEIVSVANGWQIDGRDIVARVGTESETTTYEIADAHGATATGRIVVSVAENQAPTVTALELTTPYETPLRIDVSPQATDPDGDQLFFVCCETIRGGSITEVGSGPGQLELTFTPEAGFFGSAGFSYTVDDQNGHQSAGAVAIVVDEPDNRPPTAFDNTVTVPQGENQRIDLAALSEDPDPEDTLTWSLGAIDGTGFTAVVEGSQVVVSVDRETPEGPAGDFDFIVADDSLSATGTVTVVVTQGANRAPTASDTQVEIAAASSMTVDLASLVTDPDPGDQLRYEIDATAGEVEASLTGTLATLRAPASAPLGVVTFGYVVVDSRDAQAQGSIQVEVVAPTVPEPSAVDDSATTRPGVAVDVEVLANDIDPLGEGLQVVSAESGQGQASVVGQGRTVRFDPQEFVGATTVTYTIRDVAGREASGTIDVETMGVPDQPAPPEVTADAGQVTLTWTAPQSNGRPINGYTVTIASGDPGGTHQVDVQNTFTWTGLTNGTTYTFTVTAHNELGASPPSDPSRQATPDIVPEAPAAPTVQFGDGALTVAWQPPTNAGSDLVGYELEIGGSESGTRALGLTQSYTWTGLTNGAEYTFRVRAENGAGFGPFSAASASEHPETVPEDPVMGTVERGTLSGALNLAWLKPADGGGTIIEYRIVSEAGEALVTGADSTAYSWSDLPNGEPIQFQVQARNRAGWGPLSELSSPVVPCGPPSAAAAPSVTRGDGLVDIDFAAPDNNGCEITGYVITSSDGTVRNWTATNGSFTGLTNGQTYTFNVRAVNELGTGPTSAESSPVIPAGPPLCGSAAVTAAPTAPGELTVDWTAATDNGAAITGYELTGLGVSGVGATGDLRYAATGLAESTTYQIGLRATNDVGTSPECDTTSATTWSRPTAVNASATMDLDTEVLTANVTGGNSSTPPITDYTATFTGPGGPWVTTGSGNPPGSFTHDVTEDGTYGFSIEVCNAVGCVTTPASCCDLSVVLNAPPEQMAPPVLSHWFETTWEDFNLVIDGDASAPNDNGAAITHYEWQGRWHGSSNNWHDLTLGDTTSPSRTLQRWEDYTHLRWGNGLDFEFRVRAVNAKGAGEWSDWAHTKPPTTDPLVEVLQGPTRFCLPEAGPPRVDCAKLTVRVRGVAPQTTSTMTLDASEPSTAYPGCWEQHHSKTTASTVTSFTQELCDYERFGARVRVGISIDSDATVYWSNWLTW